MQNRILEVTESALQKQLSPAGGVEVEKKKNRGVKKREQQEKAQVEALFTKKIEVLDSCRDLVKACNNVRDYIDARIYFRRAEEGYLELLGPEADPTLDMTMK
ncbi:hypothetical protein TL16_g03396 [Triparma laevis f. inornata]|uniref:Uncharacterized protein n=1 Tax=Triparma laevis f. inornata TaxID=1714386 RepID=A0A9W7DZ83_9STRA|nr:hypothetical protein TL16_g03396 [Triparma laevis f. inornata]